MTGRAKKSYPVTMANFVVLNDSDFVVQAKPVTDLSKRSHLLTSSLKARLAAPREKERDREKNLFPGRSAFTKRLRIYLIGTDRAERNFK